MSTDDVKTVSAKGIAGIGGWTLTGATENSSYPWKNFLKALCTDGDYSECSGNEPKPGPASPTPAPGPTPPAPKPTPSGTDASLGTYYAVDHHY